MHINSPRKRRECKLSNLYSAIPSPIRSMDCLCYYLASAQHFIIGKENHDPAAAPHKESNKASDEGILLMFGYMIDFAAHKKKIFHCQNCECVKVYYIVRVLRLVRELKYITLFECQNCEGVKVYLSKYFCEAIFINQLLPPFSSHCH